VDRVQLSKGFTPTRVGRARTKALHKRCAGLDVHKEQVVACLRLVNRGKAMYELRRYSTTTRGLLELADWLEQAGCADVAMEATGVYWITSPRLPAYDRFDTFSKGVSNRSWPTPHTSRVYPGARAT
jgi:hypothetical protein